MRGFDHLPGYAPHVAQLIRPPLIGVSTSEMRIPARTRSLAESEPPMRELALGMSYPLSIERAGALPVVLAPVDPVHVDALLDRLDGLMLSGGPDIHPSAYGEDEHPALGPTERDLDLFELALVRAADARGMPILGVCRGLQIVNVARGGSLIQDLPDAVGEQINHRQEEPGRVPTHSVMLEAGARLEGVMGRMEHRVNTFHHQAVKRLGHHLNAVAFAPDGVIEGIEATDRDFLLGVQWHAESLADREDQAGLFAAFIAAAARYGAPERQAEAA